MTDKKRTSDQAFGDEENPFHKKFLPQSNSPQSHSHGDVQNVESRCISSSSSQKIGDDATVTAGEDVVPTGNNEERQAADLQNSQSVRTAVQKAPSEDGDETEATRQNSEESVTTQISIASHVSEVDPDDAEAVAHDFTVLADLIDTTARRCTYPQGYVKRQLVYACRTCTLDVLEPAGICLACALNCHDEHDIVGLLTRRNFRCDCGNNKFGPRNCQLAVNKEPLNEQNVYNENFHGKICVCQKPIDSNAVGEEHETVQCRICEEQYHPVHIGIAPEEFGEEWDGELACITCLKKYPFLQLYAHSFAKPSLRGPPVEGRCVLAELRAVYRGQEPSTKGVVFRAKWYEKLCKCAECAVMYETNKISFILDPEDTCAAYEEREGLKEMENVRRASQMSPEEIFAQICEGFDPVTQVELAHWFNNLREVFVDFLRTRLELGQTITETDIEEFFRSFGSNQEESDA